MSKALVAILVSEHTWRIAFVDDGCLNFHEIDMPDPMDPLDIAEKIDQDLTELEISRNEEIVLTIPSRWALAVTLKQLPEGRGWREPMRYALEEYLPVPAEDVATDFVIHDDCTFAVASLSARLKVLVCAMESCGILVGWICPSVLLALQNWLGKQDIQPDLVLLPEDNHINAVVLLEGQPTTWRLIPEGIEEFAAHVSVLLPDAPVEDDVNSLLRVLIPDGQTQLGESIRSLPGVAEVVESIDEADVAFWAGQQSQGIIRGKSKPWINLRRNDLATSGAMRPVRKPLLAVMAGLVILFVSLCLGLLWNASRYDTILQDAETRKQNAYRKVMGKGISIPQSGLERKLKIKKQSLETGTGNIEGIKYPPSALLVLQDILEGIAPEKVLFRMEELKIEKGLVRLKINAQSEQTVDRVIKALNKNEKLRLDLIGSVRGNKAYDVKGRSLRETAGR